MKKLTFLAITLLLSIVAKADSLITPPQGVEPEEFTLAITHSVAQQSGMQDTDKKMTAKLVFDGNDVYLQGLAHYFPNSYVKGTLADGKITVPSGQFVGEDQYGKEYLTGYSLDDQKNVTIADILFSYDALTRTITYNPSIYASETSAPNDPQAAMFCYVKQATYTLGGLAPLVPITVPEGLTVEPYLLHGTRTINEENSNGEFELVTEKYDLPVNIGFDGEDVYIQGIVENVDYAWAKATKDAQGKYVIPVGQYIGSSSLYNQTWDYFLAATKRMGGITDITLSYDATTNTFSTTQTIAVTSDREKADSYYTLNSVTIKKILEREATPSKPEMTFNSQKSPYGSTNWYFAELYVPLSDVEGEPMLSDKLSYVFLCDKGTGDPQPITFPSSKYYKLKEDMTEIPYDFTDGLDISRHTVYFERFGESELKTWQRLGLQTIYRGASSEKKSEICWVDLDWQALGIVTVDADSAKTNGAIYSLSGQRLQKPQRGLNIIGGKKVLIK